jgi:hypothetical protein
VDELPLLQATSPLLIVGPNKFVGCSTAADFDDDRVRQHNDRVKVLHTSLKWISVQATLLDICIAFYPIQLPPYVILEIVDKFPFWETHVNHKKKIDYIIQIKRFCDGMKRVRRSARIRSKKKK